ncbi:MAG: UDP-3-O-acyl-N-acetylglucosamine deacetylase [Vampirovibrionales bacterium]|nr:UDP-3-O-acyl-N-acetylglucosamine deacetylase [Vampirovibrionales bacterium]
MTQEGSSAAFASSAPSAAAPAQAVVTVAGTGLITGLPCVAQIERLAPPSEDDGLAHGIVFDLGDGVMIPASLAAVMHADRGVTLGDARSGQTLSIVEHFLAACALSGARHLRVRITGAPELPILDGSADPWTDALRRLGFDALEANAETQPVAPLRQAVFCRHHESACVYALPAPYFQLTYAVDFPHPGLRDVWVNWDSSRDGIEWISPARTFGFVRELPLLQAKGLARGVSADNTLGLTDEGGFTAPLRLDDEPVRHKMLDLLGDLMLAGVSPLRLGARVIAVGAGHAAHIAFARQLRAVMDVSGKALHS